MRGPLNRGHLKIPMRLARQNSCPKWPGELQISTEERSFFGQSAKDGLGHPRILTLECIRSRPIHVARAGNALFGGSTQADSYFRGLNFSRKRGSPQIPTAVGELFAHETGVETSRPET